MIILVNTIDKCLSPILLVALFLCLADVSIAASPFATAQLGHGSPLLLDREHNAVGTIIGATQSHDLDGKASNAYEVVSPSGYLAALLPDGSLGAVRQLHFETSTCQGLPRVPAEEGFVLPGYVFAFGKPATVYFIRKSAVTQVLTVRSVLEAGEKAATCSEVDNKGNFFTAESKLVVITGFMRHDYGSLSTAENIAEVPAKDSKRSMFRELDSGPARSLLYQPGLPACAAGCEQSLIANGICESECNNVACGYDPVDCRNQD
ncbi:MAG: hypothetical protein GY875_17885 [Gammaproteobacteria bacterium]|nr:hypothetical protein [Gammaproteobacteria bacterium]